MQHSEAGRVVVLRRDESCHDVTRRVLDGSHDNISAGAAKVCDEQGLMSCLASNSELPRILGQCLTRVTVKPQETLSILGQLEVS